jgi:hypothetical protein
MADTVRAARTPTAIMAAALVASSAATLGTFALVGSRLPLRHALVLAAIAIAIAAVLGDALAIRVRPQIPLQVPEPWRRTLPLPLASLLYGALLGSGLSSAMPVFAGWAIVGLAFATGRPESAVLVGLALGVGRALPIVLDVQAAARPRGLRLVRSGCACALALTVTALAPSVVAAAARIAPAVDPSAAGGDLAWQQPGAGGFLMRAGAEPQQLPGADPAIGGALIAWHDGDTVTVADRATLQPRFQERVVGVHQLALSDQWLVMRQVQPDGTWRLIAQSIADTNVHRVIAETRPPRTVGRPAVDGATAVYSLSSRKGSSILAVALESGKATTVRLSRFSLLLDPSLLGERLLYDEVARCGQFLRIGPVDGAGGRVLYSLPPLAGQDSGRERGHPREGARTPCRSPVHPTTSMLWSTALADGGAYVTVLAEGGASVLAVRIP